MFAVKVGALAIPLASVITDAVALPPVKVPPAPEPGAVNVTFTPASGALPPSLTVACNAVGNAVPGITVWPSPAVATIDAGAFPVITSVKLFGVFGHPAASAAVIVIGKLPACVGVPESVLPENDKPAGKPPDSEKAYDELPPEAANDWVYGVPVEPLAIAAVVIVTGVQAGPDVHAAAETVSV